MVHPCENELQAALVDLRMMPAGVSSWDAVSGLAIALEQILHESQTNIVSSRYLPLRSFAVPARLDDPDPNVVRIRPHLSLPHILARLDKFPGVYCSAMKHHRVFVSSLGDVARVLIRRFAAHPKFPRFTKVLCRLTSVKFN